MKRTIALSLCLAFVASAAFAFPPGMPPKENPLVTKVAPENPGIFFSWQGSAPADASSTNKVEQALAKPEVKEELAKIQASIVENYGGNPFAKECFNLAFKNGACFYSLDAKENFAGMIALDANGPEQVEKLTAEMKKIASSGEISVSTINIGKMPFFKVSNTSGAEEFYWGALGKGRVLVVANNQKGLTSVLNNARTPDPAWITDVKKDFGIERLSTLSEISGKFINDNAENKATEEDADPAMAEFQKKFLGGEHLDRIVSASGLDNTGAVQKMAFYMKDGWKSTLPGLMIDKSLSDKDLSVIPSNAVVAVAGKTDLNGLFKAVSQAEGLPDEMKMQIAMAGMVVTPYLSSMGDSWAFFMTDEGAAPGGALVWSLKNPAMAKIQLKQLMEMLKNNMQKTEMQIDEMGMNNRELRVIPTQLDLFGDDEEEAEDDPMPGMKIQVIPGGQIPPGAIPGGALPNGAVPMGGGQIQLGGGNVDPALLMGLIPESIEKIKIGSYDFWLLKNGEDNSNNFVIGIAGKNLVVTTKSYAEKYVEFDGTKNISSNKAVAKMMTNNPSYLLYANPEFVSGFATGLLQMSGNMPSEAIMGLMTATNLPIVMGVYSTDNAVRVDATSGLPLPDLFMTAVGGTLHSQATGN